MIFENHPYYQRAVTDQEALSALNLAQTKLGCDYVWGSNGPDTFDCSGLIVWAYQQVLGRKDIFNVDGDVVDDVTIDSIYRYNSAPLDESQVKSGDIIFITSETDYITHGGLVVSMDADTVTFINASSNYGSVVVDTWDKSAVTSGQWIAGYGRLMVMDRK